MTSSYPLKPLSAAVALDIDDVAVDPRATYEIAGVYSFGRGVFGRGPITGTDTSYRSLNRLHSGQLVLSRLKAFEGAIAVVPEDFDGWFLSQEFPTFSCLEGVADPGYIGYLCRWPAFWEQLAGTSRGVGARRERVHPEDLLSVDIPLPSIAEQRRVVDRMRKVYQQLDEIGTRDSASEDLVRALTPSLLNTEYKRHPLGELVRQVRREQIVDPSTEYRLLGVRWYGEGLFVREEKPGNEIAAKKLYRVESGDFVYNRLFAWKGSFAVAGEESAGCHVSGEFPTFEVDREAIDVRYLLGLFSDPAVWEIVEDHSVGGTPTSRNRLKEAMFLKLEVPLPPMNEQRELAGLVDRVRAVRHLGKRRQRYEDALRGAVLNEAFSGVMR